MVRFVFDMFSAILSIPWAMARGISAWWATVGEQKPPPPLPPTPPRDVLHHDAWFPSGDGLAAATSTESVDDLDLGQRVIAVLTEHRRLVDESVRMQRMLERDLDVVDSMISASQGNRPRPLQMIQHAAHIGSGPTAGRPAGCPPADLQGLQQRVIPGPTDLPIVPPVDPKTGKSGPSVPRAKPDPKTWEW